MPRVWKERERENVGGVGWSTYLIGTLGPVQQKKISSKGM